MTDETKTQQAHDREAFDHMTLDHEMLDHEMLDHEMLDAESLNNIHFVSSTLAPFFLHDPVLDDEALLPLLEAFAKADAYELAEAWPFVEQSDIYPYLRMIVEGAQPNTTSASETAASHESSDFESLAEEYRRLFVGPTQKEAPPWGSVYTDKDGVVFGGTTMQLEDWLAENGIAITDTTSGEPEDSLGTLLALLSWLTEERPELVLDLLRLHILPWSSHFLELMGQQARHPFYQGLAAVTRLSLEGMQDIFDLVVKTPRFYR